ncbi:pH-response regulator protein palH/RIM21 [Calycina marina]|uniref:PH-response regulator protein palH/RIM21 n=1 Tax=Calycina marina TaxID=1763456 RepID=A0A9P7YWE7_9HELO|nr:pH-response regulator protein palH/RIM21 [Calycina marina]
MDPRAVASVFERSSTVGVATTSTPTQDVPLCTPFTLPANGILTLSDNTVVTLTSDIVFAPSCTASPDTIRITNEIASISTITDFRDPFYESTLPQCYALAATTVIAYMLFIMLLITPRTFLHQGAIVLGRRGFTNGPSGSDAGIGIGGRPWLQKVAALTVAVSLSLATADTFRVAEVQYNAGIMDANDLQRQVEDGLELKIIRLISDTFLWLAQAQTLIRLFPRQREKIIIKWTAFALILLDVIFSILNNFVYENASRPKDFQGAVPALTYLFQLTLSLLYCAWVLYYSLSKRRVAFYHPQMRNICLIALLSLCSILIPVVFFVLDVSKPRIAVWGDYVRWVGAAAASVIVWEWVERIECLERNDKKDGILGREVFDGDEMLDPNPGPDFKLKLEKSHNTTDFDHGGSGDNGAATGRTRILWPGLSSRHRFHTRSDIEIGTRSDLHHPKNTKRKLKALPNLWHGRPDPVATPVSRSDTASAESTVYAVRYHPISETTPRPQERGDSLEITQAPFQEPEPDQSAKNKVIEQMELEDVVTVGKTQHSRWQGLTKANPFHRKLQQPPAEVSAHQVKPVESNPRHETIDRWDVRTRMEEFAATQAEKLREKHKPPPAPQALSRTVIPAPVRRRNLNATLAEIEEGERENSPNRGASHAAGIDDMSARLSPISPSNGHAFAPSPSELIQRSQSQRGTVSLSTNELPGHSPISFASPVSSSNRSQPSATSVSFQSSSSRQSRSPGDHLPVHSIPAPPRRPRNNDD